MSEQKTIYVVDDDEDDRMILREMLSTFVEEVNIVEISDGMQLCSLLDAPGVEMGPCLVLIDINMPRMNGLELLQILKADPRWRSLPMIMLSTTSNPLFINKAYELGANAFLVKPVTMNEFEWMCQMVNFCFLSNFAMGKVPTVSRGPEWRSVVVVEDNDDHWDLMKFSLERGVRDINLTRVQSVGHVPDLLEKLRDDFRKPDVILLDLYFPSRDDGLRTLEAVRGFLTTERLPNVPIIVFSYSNDHQDMKDALAGFANAYMVKPEDVSLWPVYLRNLCSVWSNAASLPQAV